MKLRGFGRLKKAIIGMMPARKVVTPQSEADKRFDLVMSLLRIVNKCLASLNDLIRSFLSGMSLRLWSIKALRVRMFAMSSVFPPSIKLEKFVIDTAAKLRIAANNAMSI